MCDSPNKDPVFDRWSGRIGITLFTFFLSAFASAALYKYVVYGLPDPYAANQAKVERAK